MGKQKLTPTIVKRIKALLKEVDGNGKCIHTHAEIGRKYKISREAITKINLGLKDSNNPHARWTDVE